MANSLSWCRTTGYRVFLRSSSEEWKSHETLAAEAKVTNTHVIHGLKCGSKYQVYIMAFNEIGNSDASESLAFTTDGGGESISRLVSAALCCATRSSFN